MSGTWKERQLFSELQSIIQKYPVDFDGEQVIVNDDPEGQKTETENAS